MIYTLTYILFTAFSSILRGIVGSNMPIMLMVFLSTTIAIIFFHAINAKNIKNTYRKIKDFKELYVMTAVSALILWVGSFSVPVYYSATIQVFSVMLITSFYGSLSLHNQANDFMNRLRLPGILLLLVIFYGMFFLHHSFMRSLGMFAMTIVTGSFGYLYFSYSHKLNQKNFSASEILAVRFWPLFLVSLFCVLKYHQYNHIDLKALRETVLISITSLIAPAYASQKSIEKIGPSLHSVLIGLAPFMTFSLERLIFKANNGLYGYLSIALFMIIAVPYFSHKTASLMPISK